MTDVINPSCDKTEQFRDAIQLLFPKSSDSQVRDDKLTELLNNNPEIITEIDEIIKELIFDTYSIRFEKALVMFSEIAMVKDVVKMEHIQDELKEHLVNVYGEDSEETVGFPVDKLVRDEHGVPVGTKKFKDMDPLPLVTQGNNVLKLMRDVMKDSLYMGLILGLLMHE